MKFTFKLLMRVALLYSLLLSGCGESARSAISLNQPRDTTTLIPSVVYDRDWTWFVWTDAVRSESSIVLNTYFTHNIPIDVEHFQYFIDSDNNATTGFSFDQDAWSVDGADYLIEDAKLYKSNSHTNWSWDYVRDIDIYTKNIEGDIARILIETNGDFITKDSLNITIKAFNANWDRTYSTIATQTISIADDNPNHVATKTLYEDFESATMDKWTIEHDAAREGYEPAMENVVGFNGTRAGKFQASYVGSQNTYKLLTPNTKEFVLELDIAVNSLSMLNHGMLGLYIETVQGPRLIYWDAYRNQRHRDANNGTYPSITYYDEYAIIANEISAEPTEKIEGLKYVHLKVDIDVYLQRFESNNHVIKVDYFLNGQANIIDNITLSSQ